MPSRWSIEDVADALGWAGVALLALYSLVPHVERLVTAWTP